jgi:hypothetical protein
MPSDGRALAGSRLHLAPAAERGEPAGHIPQPGAIGVWRLIVGHPYRDRAQQLALMSHRHAQVSVRQWAAAPGRPRATRPPSARSPRKPRAQLVAHPKAHHHPRGARPAATICAIRGSAPWCEYALPMRWAEPAST